MLKGLLDGMGGGAGLAFSGRGEEAAGESLGLSTILIFFFESFSESFLLGVFIFSPGKISLRGNGVLSSHCVLRRLKAGLPLSF